MELTHGMSEVLSFYILCIYVDVWIMLECMYAYIYIHTCVFFNFKRI